MKAGFRHLSFLALTAAHLAPRESRSVPPLKTTDVSVVAGALLACRKLRISCRPNFILCSCGQGDSRATLCTFSFLLFSKQPADWPLRLSRFFQSVRATAFEQPALFTQELREMRPQGYAEYSQEEILAGARSHRRAERKDDEAYDWRQ
jgi:hypothetical protein